ncbi:DUF1310 family protein [Streptococcus ferus]|uniref:DUF1310 family protein n=1 Tax=Streptococcus ferus TaxID=1345 RepID=UPI002355017D|nr:DUF1310 family protein [Streptococcus ferus]
MKKGLKVLICLLAIIGIGVGGFAVYQHQEKEKMIKIATSPEAKKIYEQHMKAQDSHALTAKGIIKSYDIDTDTLEYNPMGGMMVRVYVNGDKALGFQFNILQNEDGELESGSYVIYPKLANLLEE